MNVNINVTFEGLDGLSSAIALLGSAIGHHNGMENTVKALDEIKSNGIKEKAEEGLKEIAKDLQKESTEEVKEETSSYTRDDVRDMFISLKKEKKASAQQLKDILTKYESENISNLEEKHFDNVMKELEALK